MKLSDFARQRKIPRDTITQYIRRNSELFEGHTKVDGKWLIIDETAEELLNEKYPLPQMVQIIEDTESRAKLIKAQEAIIQLQGQLNEATTKIAQAEAVKLMLEDKEEQLEKTEERLLKTENTLETERTEAKQAIEQYKADIARLQEELAQERSKTWIQKLFRL